MTLQNEQPEIRQAVAKCLAGAVQDIAGGDLTHDAEREKMMELASKSISFPNKNNFCAGGKPHDIEIRLALSLFHKWKRSSSKDQVEIISDMGVTRFIPSPKELAELILLPFESACRREGVAQDVRCQPSGLLCIVTRRRGEILRQAGKLPCPYCTKWCQGEKGLWWHQQQNHKIEYSEAAEVAASSTDSLAIVLFDPSRADSNTLSEIIPIEAPAAMVGSSQPLDYVKNNNLKALQREVNVSLSRFSCFITRMGLSTNLWRLSTEWIFTS